VAGIVLNVETGERFTATEGGGAFLDGTRLAVSTSGEPTPLSQRLVATGFSYVQQVRTAQAAAVAALLQEVRDIRRLGSAALDLCAVAAGRVDAYVEEGLNPVGHGRRRPGRHRGRRPAGEAHRSGRHGVRALRAPERVRGVPRPGAAKRFHAGIAGNKRLLTGCLL
jgi:hypothetical protein